MSISFERARTGAVLTLPGYPVSSPDLLAVARRQLRESVYPSLRRVTCDYHEGVVMLRGRLPSFFLKQMAQESVRELDGVEVIANYIEVAIQIDGPPQPQVIQPYVARASGGARTAIRREHPHHGSVESSRLSDKEVF